MRARGRYPPREPLQNFSKFAEMRFLEKKAGIVEKKKYMTCGNATSKVGRRHRVASDNNNNDINMIHTLGKIWCNNKS